MNSPEKSEQVRPYQESGRTESTVTTETSHVPSMIHLRGRQTPTDYERVLI